MQSLKLHAMNIAFETLKRSEQVEVIKQFNMRLHGLCNATQEYYGPKEQFILQIIGPISHSQVEDYVRAVDDLWDSANSGKLHYALYHTAINEISIKSSPGTWEIQTMDADGYGSYWRVVTKTQFIKYLMTNIINSVHSFLFDDLHISVAIDKIIIGKKRARVH